MPEGEKIKCQQSARILADAEMEPGKNDGNLSEPIPMVSDLWSDLWHDVLPMLGFC